MTSVKDKEYDTYLAVQRVTAAMQRGDVAAARIIARGALDAGLEHPFLIKVEALYLHQTGALQDALRMFHHARTLDPADPMILNGIAGVMAAMGQPGAALKLVEGALAMAPQLVPSNYLQAWLLDQLGDHAGACAAYRRTLELSPDYPQALSGLAAAAARMGDYPTARAAAEKALAQLPGDATASLALALVEIGTGDTGQAKARLAPFLGASIQPAVRVPASRMLAQAFAVEGDSEKSFEAYVQANDVLKTANARLEPAAQAMAADIRRLAEDIAANGLEPGPAADMPAKAQVFVVGFPDGAGAAAERVLAGAPQAVVLSGTDHLAEAAGLYLSGSLAQLRAAGAEELSAWRESYWHAVAEQHGALEGRVVIDPRSMNILKLPLIARLFPDARIVLALRDPRDAVLNCFRTSAATRPLDYALLDLDAGAALYDLIMTLAETVLGQTSLRNHRARHEDFAADFAGQTRALEAFCGLTPGMSQVPAAFSPTPMRGWKVYAAQMTGVLPILARWAKALGYPD